MHLVNWADHKSNSWRKWMSGKCYTVSFFFGENWVLVKKKNNVEIRYKHHTTTTIGNWKQNNALILATGWELQMMKGGRACPLAKSNFIRIPNSGKNRSLTAPYNFQYWIFHKLLKTLEDIVSLRFIWYILLLTVSFLSLTTGAVTPNEWPSGGTISEFHFIVKRNRKKVKLYDTIILSFGT